MDENGTPQGPGVGVGTVVVVATVVSVCVSLAVVGLAAVAFLVMSVSPFAVSGPDATLRKVSRHDAPTEALDADPATPVESTFDADDHAPRLYRFELPADTVYVRADLAAGESDLDLRVTFGEAAAREERWRVTSDDPSGDESAWLARDDDPQFAREPFMVRIDRYADEGEDVDYTLALTVVRYSTLGRLAPGETARGTVSPESGNRAAYDLVIPAGVETVRVDLVDVRQDLDLAADVTPVLDPEHAAASALTSLGRESLVLDRGALRLGDGERTLSLLVVDRGWLDREIPFEIVVSAGDAPPDAVRRLPDLPRGRSAAERVALGVVGIVAGGSEGSGVVVGRERRILTAAHVVDEVEDDAPDVVICVLTDVEREPVEMLRGKVIRRDDDRDVAIIEVTSTLHGDPLPDGWSLPRTPLRPSDRPVALGDVVHACGFPVLHDGDERSEVTWTTGVVCGWERPQAFPLVRFDAEISSGSSGGALLDSELRLVGLTVAMHGDLAEFSATGLALPVAELPADWMELLE